MHKGKRWYRTTKIIPIVKKTSVTRAVESLMCIIFQKKKRNLEGTHCAEKVEHCKGAVRMMDWQLKWDKC